MKIHVKSIQNKFQRPLTFLDVNGVVTFLEGKNLDNYKIYILENAKEKSVSLNYLKSLEQSV